MASSIGDVGKSISDTVIAVSQAVGGVSGTPGHLRWNITPNVETVNGKPTVVNAGSNSGGFKSTYTKFGQGPVTHGYMVSTQGTSAKLNFQFNPSEVRVGYMIDDSLLSPDFMTSYQKTLPNMFQGQTYSFDLYFDRIGGGDPDGVLQDVATFETMVGVTTPGGVISSLPLRVVFGTKFTVEGYISAAAVNYNRFNSLMVPYECTIAVTLRSSFFKEDIAASGVAGQAPPATPILATPRFTP